MFRRVLHTCLLALAALLIAGLASTAYAQTDGYTPTSSNGGTAYLAPAGKAQVVGGIWMVAGTLFGAWKTRGFREPLSFEVPAE